MNTYDAFTTITLSISANSISGTSHSEAEEKFLETIQLFLETITIKDSQSALSVEVVDIDQCQLLRNNSSTTRNSYTSMTSLLAPTLAPTPVAQTNRFSSYNPLVRASS